VNKTVSCWGKNDRHQLANGTTDASSRPVPLFGIVGVEELVVAGDSACVRLGDGDVRCWGANDAGQLGDATRPDHDVPASIRFSR
jgi:alpha-tubulin suppressor-like RCC1 family protein